MPQAPIDKLDASTRAKLRSTQILTSLPQLVSELVQNSLDAGATLIDIGVNCEEWLCWVRDNGCGISKEGLSTLSKDSEEGRYRTSKTYAPGALNSLSTFGFRGEALASAAELSCLEISSRTVNSRETWSIITKGGRNLYSGPAVRWRRESSGTVVCIRDAFYNLPVRRLSHLPPTRTLELIRQEIETFALVFPNVAFTLEALSNERGAGPSKGKTFRIPKTSSSLASFRNLYGRALIEHTEVIDLSSGTLKLEGFISLNGAHSQSYQFLYVNRHPIARCELHKIIDTKFASSSFAKNALDEEGETSLPRSSLRRSPRKAEKRPVYVLNLTVPPEEVDNSLEPAKTNVLFQDRNVVATFLSTSIQSFLIRHGFSTCHQTSRAIHHEDPPSARKRRKKDMDDSGYAESMDNYNSTPDTKEHSRTPEAPDGPLLLYDDVVSEEVTWIDPNTAETFIVDTRTGNSRPHAPSPPNHRENEADPSRSHLQSRRTISLHTNNPTRAQSDVPSWLQQALEGNRVYEVTENLIPALKVPNSTFDPTISIHHHSCNTSTSHPGIADPVLSALSHRFGKAELLSAQVINQVDRKFIACLVKDQLTAGNSIGGCDSNLTGRALVLIDQHAADERVRVERFLKELCEGFLYNRTHGSDGVNGVQTREISPPKPLLLTIHEASRLGSSQDIQQAFYHWGFSFANLSAIQILQENEARDSDLQYTQVQVQAIPEVVADKLLLGDELQELVKGYLGQLEIGITLTQNPVISDVSTSHDEFSWLKALRWCPRELLDLVNSKACRGAIMFNDTLTVLQCENLVKGLSETAFPFQCAHGRPSLVPLANIGTHSGRETKRLPLPKWSRLVE